MAGTWIKHWLQCGGRVAGLSCCAHEPTEAPCHRSQEGWKRAAAWASRKKALYILGWGTSDKACWRFPVFLSIWPVVLHHQLVSMCEDGGSQVPEPVSRVLTVYDQIAHCLAFRIASHSTPWVLCEESIQPGGRICVWLRNESSNLVGFRLRCRRLFRRERHSSGYMAHIVVHYVGIAVICFSAGAYIGAVGFAFPRSAGGWKWLRCLVPLLSDNPGKVDDICCLEIILGCCLEHFASSVTYCRSL